VVELSVSNRVGVVGDGLSAVGTGLSEHSAHITTSPLITSYMITITLGY